LEIAGQSVSCCNELNLFALGNRRFLPVQELSDGFADEFFAYRGPQHDVLQEKGPGKLCARGFDLDCGWQITSLLGIDKLSGVKA